MSELIKFHDLIPGVIDYIVTMSFGRILYCGCFNLFCNVWMCVCGCFGNV